MVRPVGGKGFGKGKGPHHPRPFVKKEAKEEEDEDEEDAGLTAHGHRVPGRRLPPPGEAEWEWVVEAEQANEHANRDCVFF